MQFTYFPFSLFTTFILHVEIKQRPKLLLALRPGRDACLLLANQRTLTPGGGGGGAPYNGLYWDVPPERGSFFTIQVNETIRISAFEAYKSGQGNLSFRSVKPKRANSCIFMATKKDAKPSGFVIYSYFKDGPFAAVEKDSLGMQKLYHLLMKFFRRDTFSVKNGIQKIKGFEPPRIKHCSVPPPPPHPPAPPPKCSNVAKQLAMLPVLRQLLSPET